MPLSKTRLCFILAAVLAALGVVFLVVGIMYLTLSSSSLPGFFPGHISYSHFKHTQRGTGALVLAGLCFLLGAVSYGVGRRRIQSRWMR